MPTAIATSNINSLVSAFSFEGEKIRIVNQSGEPWWILTDVCKVLEISNSPKAATRLDSDEKSTISISDSGNLNADRTIINESGLYSLILTSRKPAAKRFKKWVTAEVLPTIRKTGGYSVATARPKRIRKPALDTTYLRLLKVAATIPYLDSAQQRFKAASGTHRLTGVNPLQLLGEDSSPTPNNETFLTPTSIGAQLGLSARRVNQLLIEHRFQKTTLEVGSGSRYTYTEKGAPFARVFEAVRLQGQGTQEQLKWSGRIVEELRPFAQVMESFS